MHYGIVVRTLGQYLLFYSACFLIPLAQAFLKHEKPQMFSFIFVLIIGLVIGWGLGRIGRSVQKKEGFTRRDGLFLVPCIWIVSSLLGSIPFYWSGYFGGWISSVFETVSGFTTTGASVLTDIESVPSSLLLWRSLTHWLGGLGIIVVFVALLPNLGVTGKFLMRFEVPGPAVEDLQPRIRDTALSLLKIYLIFTVAETVLLRLAGMSIFDAFCHTAGTLATGGFSTRNASIAAFNSPLVEYIIILFMLAAGANFSLYYFFMRGGRNVFFRDTEFRAYLVFIFLGVLFVVYDLVIVGGNGVSVRDSIFQVVSIQTTTGFVTADFDRWPAFSHWVLLGLMFVGGSSGSTGGGLKVIRIILVFKFISNQVVKVFRPNLIKPVRLSGRVIDERMVLNVVGLFGLWIGVFFVATLLLTCFGIDMVTAFSAVAATLNNVGPGFGAVGPTLNYGSLPGIVKGILTVCMLFGRLEIFTVIILFHPSFWRH